MKKRDLEGPIHKAILQYLHTQYPDALIHHSPNEGVRGGKRGQIDGARRKAMGQLPGFPDLIMYWRCYLWAFEVKSPQGRVSDDQKATGALIEANGGRWAVVRSVDDVQAAIKEWHKRGPLSGLASTPSGDCVKVKLRGVIS